MPDKIVNVDDISSWPIDIASFIEEQSKTANLESNPSMTAEDKILLNLLDSLYLLVYHATRLLPHEEIDIKNNGLQILTKELATNKVQGAVAGGYIDQNVGRELLAGSSLWSDPYAHRADQICFVLGKTPFEMEYSGLHSLLNIWGGESINFTEVGNKFKPKLKEIGEPAVVRAILPINRESTLITFPSLTAPFIKVYKNEPRAWSDVFWKNLSIPSSCILDIVRPEEMSAIRKSKYS